MKKPAVALIAVGLFIAAAFAATFMVAEHPQMAEVAIPLFKEVRDYMPELFGDIKLQEEDPDDKRSQG